MHFLIAVLAFSIVLAAAVPAPLQPRTDGHFWCNGVASPYICPAGQSMIPADQYACEQIANSGRTADVDPNTNALTSFRCSWATTRTANQVSTLTGDAASRASAAAAAAAAAEGSPPGKAVFRPQVSPSPVPNVGSMHLTCNRVSAAGSADYTLSCAVDRH